MMKRLQETSKATGTRTMTTTTKTTTTTTITTAAAATTTTTTTNLRAVDVLEGEVSKTEDDIRSPDGQFGDRVSITTDCQVV